MAQLGIAVGQEILSFILFWALVRKYIKDPEKASCIVDELFSPLAGNKQAVLVDSEKKSLVCKVRFSSDVFCIEFGQKVRL